MDDSREAFLEKQNNLHHDLIDIIESSRLNRQQKQGIQDLKILYRRYIDEYKALLMAQVDTPFFKKGINSKRQ